MVIAMIAIIFNANEVNLITPFQCIEQIRFFYC